MGESYRHSVDSGVYVSEALFRLNVCGSFDCI